MRIWGLRWHLLVFFFPFCWWQSSIWACIYLRGWIDQKVIQDYERCTGQQINVEKSNIFFTPNTNAILRNQICLLLGMRKALDVERYLGLPSMIGWNRIKEFLALKGRLASRIKSWTTKALSQGGKFVFIKAIFASYSYLSDELLFTS